MKLISFIKEKLKKLFNKNQVLLESKQEEKEENIELENNDEEKQMFFELYKNVKSGKVKLEQL